MYLAYWGMNAHPFEDGLPPAGAIMSAAATLSLTKIRWALHANWPAIWITGTAGVGKTVVWRAALAQAAQDGWATAGLDNPLLPLAEGRARLQEKLAAQLPAAAGDDFAAALALALKNGNKICIGVDDVQVQGSSDILEYLRWAMRLGDGAPARLQLLLCGQRRGEEVLRQASGLLSQISLRVIVPPLAPLETKRYILLRLKHAGCNRGIFTRQAAEKIYELTAGVPRHVNRVCALALFLGYALQLKKIGAEVVSAAAANLGLTAPRRKPPAIAANSAAAPSISPSPPEVPLPATPQRITAAADVAPPPPPAEIDVLANLVAQEDKKPSAPKAQDGEEDVLAALAAAAPPTPPTP